MSAVALYAARWRAVIGALIGGSLPAGITEVVIHTEAGAPLPATATLAQETARLRAIHAYHRALGWAGFGYHAQANPSGRLLEGRGWRRQGAHASGHNHRSYGIVIPGHGDRERATEACIVAIASWVMAGIAAGHLVDHPTISPHARYAAKTCPGTLNNPHVIDRVRMIVATGQAIAPSPEEVPRMTLPTRLRRAWQAATAAGVYTDGTEHETVTRAELADFAIRTGLVLEVDPDRRLGQLPLVELVDAIVSRDTHGDGALVPLDELRARAGLVGARSNDPAGVARRTLESR